MINTGDALTETELWIYLQELHLFPESLLVLEDQGNCQTAQHSPQSLSGLQAFVK